MEARAAERVLLIRWGTNHALDVGTPGLAWEEMRELVGVAGDETGCIGFGGNGLE